MKKNLRAISLLLALSPWGVNASEWPVLSRINGPSPIIDGRIHADEWSSTRSLGKFLNHEGSPATPATEAWMGADERFLYIAFRCEESQMNRIHTETIGDQRDAPVWFDDSVDFYLDIGNTGKSVFRIAVNSEGTMFDGEGSEDHDYPAWDSGAQVRTTAHKDHWEVEIAIPLEAFRHHPLKGEVIAFNAGRVRYAGGKREITGLAGNYLRPFKRFSHLLWGGVATGEQIGLVSDRRGPFYEGFPSEWGFVAENKGTTPLALTVEFPNDKEGTTTQSIPEGKHPFALSIPPEKVALRAHCRVLADGRVIYESRHTPHKSEAAQRVPQVESPFFSELIEARPEGLSKEGIMLWSHDVSGPPEPGTFSLKTGAAYSQEETFRKLGKEGAILIAQTNLANSTRSLGLAKQHGVRYMIMLDERAAREKGAMMTDKKAVWLFDPIAQEAYFEDLRTAISLANEHEAIWGVFLGDETWTKILRNLFWFMGQGTDAYPQLKEIDARIKEEYGHGKFGLPESTSDTNPYRWITTYRWLSSELVKMQRKVKEIVKEECPRLRIVAWDNQSGHLPYEIARWHGDFDVMTGQIYPSLNPARDLVGFSVRLYRDLAGIDELWPCVHIEHFAANFTPREVEALLSRTFSAGATGLHLYMSDTKGRRAGMGAFPTDRYGAPERWAATTAITDRFKEPFRVKQPDPDTVIFYSNPSYQGQGGERPKTTEVEWLYNILGHRLQGAIRFVDEIVMERQPDVLARQKVVYIPYAPIVDDAEYERIRAFVENGGTLVVCDPEAFRHRTDGSERDRSFLIPQDIRSAESLKDSAPVDSVTHRKAGKGEVYLFHSNPLLIPSVATNTAWVEWFESIQKNAGAQLALPVWQFRFPTAPTFSYSRPEGECLTGNYFQWILSEARLVANRTLQGSYQLSRPTSNEPAGEAISFSEGKLTNRYRSLQQPTSTALGENVLAWNANEPMEITLEFGGSVAPSMLRLFTRGTLPAGGYEVPTAEGQWEAIASWKEQPQEHGGDVSVHLIDLPPHQKRSGRIRFHSTEEGRRFTLAEIDLWENP